MSTEGGRVFFLSSPLSLRFSIFFFFFFFSFETGFARVWVCERAHSKKQWWSARSKETVSRPVTLAVSCRVPRALVNTHTTSKIIFHTICFFFISFNTHTYTPSIIRLCVCVLCDSFSPPFFFVDFVSVYRASPSTKRKEEKVLPRVSFLARIIKKIIFCNTKQKWPKSDASECVCWFLSVCCCRLWHFRTCVGVFVPVKIWILQSSADRILIERINICSCVFPFSFNYPITVSRQVWKWVNVLLLVKKPKRWHSLSPAASDSDLYLLLPPLNRAPSSVSSLILPSLFFKL